MTVDGHSAWLRTPDGAPAVGEPEIAVWWFPGNDHRRDKPTFDISVTVSSGVKAPGGVLLGPYPFDRVGSVAADADFSFGFALENQTRPVCTRVSWRNGSRIHVLLHELAHEWYGDSVSIESWGDMWLVEGFASFASVAVVRDARREDRSSGPPVLVGPHPLGLAVLDPDHRRPGPGAPRVRRGPARRHRPAPLTGGAGPQPCSRGSASLATRSRVADDPAYGLEGRGQWVTTSVKPRAPARPARSSKRSALSSE